MSKHIFGGIDPEIDKIIDDIEGKTPTPTDSESLRAKVDRRMRLILKSYGYAPNNDLIAQLIGSANPLIEAEIAKREESYGVIIGKAVRESLLTELEYHRNFISWGDGSPSDLDNWIVSKRPTTNTEEET